MSKQPTSAEASKLADEAQGQPSASTEAPAWHALQPEETLQTLGSISTGLSSNTAAERLSQYGANAIARERVDGALVVFLRQFKNPLLYVLLGSATLAVAVGKLLDGAVVMAVVLLNALIGFFQDFRAGKAIQSLSQMVPELATVLRDGRKLQLDAAELVPGDVITVASGDRIPADARLLANKRLRVQEAALTGESLPTSKDVAPVVHDAPLGDRSSILFGGTLVTSGTGEAVVIATGARTQLGRISELLHRAADLETPLTRALEQVGKYLTIGVGAMSVVLLGVGLLRGYGLADALLAAITLAVAAIPEGLPAIVTIALAIGVQRMAKRNAIVRKLPAVETLGSASVICSDKTGTLTRNEMTVQALWCPEGGEYRLSGIGYAPSGALSQAGKALSATPADALHLLEAAALCNDAGVHQVDGRWHLSGDPTEGALVVAALKVGVELEQARVAYARIDAIPFESEQQFMATLHADGGGRVVFLKGAPEVILGRCAPTVDRQQVAAQVDALAAQGMRVLAIAEKRLPSSEQNWEGRVDEGLRLLGLAAMIDPPRDEVVDAIRACHAAGIVVKMITGDHQKTAEAIANQLGISAGHAAVTGQELSGSTAEQLFELALTRNVFARVAPEHKLGIVKALQSVRHIVAMTGDGVNDAPALKQADIGVAMGITGTSVSKDAADIVLADDNFASIAAAVEEGRRVYDNLIKSLAFVLPTNLGLSLILVVAVAFFPLVTDESGAQSLLLPMSPIQLLWINLVAAVALALPLAFEAKEPNVMARAPRASNEPVLNRFVLMRTVFVAVLMTGSAIGLFLGEYEHELTRVPHELALREGQTMTMVAVIFFQIFYLLNCRSLRSSVFKIGFFSNPSVFLGIAVLALAQAALMYWPPLQRIFGTAPLRLPDLGFAALAGALILPVVSVEKWWRARHSTTDPPRPAPR